jgi:hypothetical protein
MNTKKHEMKNRAFDSEKGVGVLFFHFLLIIKLLILSRLNSVLFIKSFSLFLRLFDHV